MSQPAKTLVNELRDLGITESVVVDVLRDKQGGVAALNRLKTELDAQKKQEQDQKVTECSVLFPTLSQAFIRSVLAEHKWDVEASVGPLVDAADALSRKTEEAKKTAAPAKPSNPSNPSPSSPAPAVQAQPKARSTVSIAVPSRAEFGDAITVRWVVQEGVPQSSDWIALCPLDAQHSQYKTYNWVDPTNTSGTLTLVAPNEPGTYQCRYLTKHYELQGASAPIHVGPMYELKTVIADTRIVCNWKQAFGADHSRAWAGLYSVGAPEASYIEMLWTSGKSGEVSFAKPLQPGQYEVRLFSGGYVEVARSSPLTVAQLDSIRAVVSEDLTKLEVYGEIKSNVDVSYCWVGLYESNAPDKSYLESQYLKTPKYELTMANPGKRGKYEVRLFSGRGYDCRLCTYSFEY
jgi:hypothetical protein